MATVLSGAQVSPSGEPGPISAGLPIGAVIEWGGPTPPTGWIFGYGQAISRTTYAALFLAYGTTHGAGDGSTTFNVFDSRGRVVASPDQYMGCPDANRLNDALGANARVLGYGGGTDTTTLSTGHLSAHSHTYNGQGTAGSNFAYGSNWYWQNVNTSNTGSNTPFSNLQPTLLLPKIIFTGVY